MLGIFLLFWGQSRTVETITEALQPDASEELVDRLRTHRRLHCRRKLWRSVAVRVYRRFYAV
ncbi:MAG UNVERIFIED_CONTAM: hypothetical protein LVR29_15030 [Microcystis novacekii LVE1205-3]